MPIKTIIAEAIKNTISSSQNLMFILSSTTKTPMSLPFSQVQQLA